MRVVARMQRIPTDEVWAPEAIAGLVGQTVAWNGPGIQSEATIVEAREEGGWVVAVLDVPDASSVGLLG
jgi:hypothetical protein